MTKQSTKIETEKNIILILENITGKVYYGLQVILQEVVAGAPTSIVKKYIEKQSTPS